jgi:hypothetical protein
LRVRSSARPRRKARSPEAEAGRRRSGTRSTALRSRLVSVRA